MTPCQSCHTIIPMAKHIPAAGGITREAISKRIKDEMSGIQQGADFSAGTPHKKDAAPVPDIMELGLPSSVRKQLQNLMASHCELGKIEREAKKDRDGLTVQIKELLAEHVPEDVPSFACEDIRVSRYTQNRPRFDKDVMKVALLRLGVQPRITNQAMAEATSMTAVVTLRISTIGEDDA